jgi:hypothetical protein
MIQPGCLTMRDLRDLVTNGKDGEELIAAYLLQPVHPLEQRPFPFVGLIEEAIFFGRLKFDGLAGKIEGCCQSLIAAGHAGQDKRQDYAWKALRCRGPEDHVIFVLRTPPVTALPKIARAIGAANSAPLDDRVGFQTEHG